MRYVYWILSIASLGLLVFEAPGGSLLTTTPERGKVGAAKGAKGSGPSARGGGAFIFLGGGYRGGK